MMSALKQGLRSYVYLLDMKDYKRREMLGKIFLSPLILVLNTALFLFTGTAFLLERLFFVPFRQFIRIQARIFRKRILAEQAFKRVYTLGSFLVFLLFLPLNLVYLAGKLLKGLGKTIMKILIAFVDFTDRYLEEEKGILLFDDLEAKGDATLEGILKDFSQTEDVVDTFAAMMEEVEKERLESETKDPEKDDEEDV